MVAMFGSIPFWAVAVGALSTGLLSDAWMARGATITRVRKSMAGAGLGFATLLLPAALAEGRGLSLALLTLACFSYGLFSGTCWAMTQSLAGPRAAGKWTGLQNGLGNVAGLASPYVAGWIVSETKRFHEAFAVACALLLVGVVSLLWIVGRLEPHDWEPRDRSA
jgi:MFS family permease